MKKIIKPFVLVAAAAMALASCQKNEISAPEKQDVHFTINAGIETKTSIVESADKDENGKPIYHAQWDGDEELGLLFAAPTDKTEAKDVVTLANTISGRTATFQGNVTVDPTSGTFYAFYPASAFACGYADGDARLDLKNTQKPTATSFDPTCDILVAKPYNYEVVDGKVVADGLEFARLMSVLRIDLKSEFADIQNEFVESVSFTAGDVKITGYARIFLDNPKFDKWESNGTQWCTVTANYDSELVSINGASNSVYLVIAPVTIPANKDLTFEIKTKNYNISKTIKSPEMKFTAGKVSKINLTIMEKNCEKVDMTVDYSGEYLIVGDNNGAKYAALKYDGSSSNLKGTALTMEDDKILEFDAMADSKMIVTKVADGTYAGLYTIQDASDKYLCAASSSANNLKSSAISNTTPEHYYWSITESDGVYEIIASKSDNRNVMQFNYNNGSPIFSCYSSASQKAVALYAYSDIKPDTTPKISVKNKSYSVLATDTSVEIPYEVKNITGAIAATIADGATLTNVKATVAGANVTVTFDANTESTEKTVTIVLSYEGAESVNVTITQAAKEAEGGDVESGWVLTSFADLKAGDQVVIVSTKGSAIYAMSNNNGTGSAPSTVDVKYSNNKLSAEPGATIVWYVGVDGSNRIFYTDSGKTKWLYCTSTNNGVRVGTNANKTFAWDSSNYLKHVGTSRFIGVYNNSDWRCYTTNTGNSNIASQTFQFFVKSGNAGGETPEEPETPVQPTKLSTPVVKCSDSDITENSLKFTWDAVANASKYVVTFNNGTSTETPDTYYEATGLNANTKYSISVKAVGDGVNYTESDAGTAEGTTKEAQQPDDTQKYYVKVTSSQSDWSGTYLIIGDTGSKLYAFASMNAYNSESYGKYSSVSESGTGKILSTSTIDAYQVVIAKSTNGYTIKFGDYYLGKSGTSGNTMQANKSYTAKKYEWKIALNSIQNANATSYYLQWNSNSGQERFSCYKNTQKNVMLYKLEE